MDKFSSLKNTKFVVLPVGLPLQRSLFIRHNPKFPSLMGVCGCIFFYYDVIPPGLNTMRLDLGQFSILNSQFSIFNSQLFIIPLLRYHPCGIAFHE